MTHTGRRDAAGCAHTCIGTSEEDDICVFSLAHPALPPLSWPSPLSRCFWCLSSLSLSAASGRGEHTTNKKTPLERTSSNSSTRLFTRMRKTVESGNSADTCEQTEPETMRVASGIANTKLIQHDSEKNGECAYRQASCPQSWLNTRQRLCLSVRPPPVVMVFKSRRGRQKR